MDRCVPRSSGQTKLSDVYQTGPLLGHQLQPKYHHLESMSLSIINVFIVVCMSSQQRLNLCRGLLWVQESVSCTVTGLLGVLGCSGSCSGDPVWPHPHTPPCPPPLTHPPRPAPCPPPLPHPRPQHTHSVSLFQTLLHHHPPPK